MSCIHIISLSEDSNFSPHNLNLSKAFSTITYHFNLMELP